MGQFHSRRGAEEGWASEEADLPVMGHGCDALYDAALVGDWTRLVKLCEVASAAARRPDTNECADGDGLCNDYDAYDARGALQQDELRGPGEDDADKENKDASLTSRITALKVFDGGQDYSMDVSLASSEGRASFVKGGGATPLQHSLISEEGAGEDDGEHDEGEDGAFEGDVGGVGASEQELQSEISADLQLELPFVPFADATGNSPLHLACRRDPPLQAVQSLLNLHPPWAWEKTQDGCIPLHLACHCGCDVEVAAALLDAMEAVLDRRTGDSSQRCNDRDEECNTKGEENGDPLLPRDARGRTPLHLACAASRDPRRRPHLIQLLLLRSSDPRRAALERDWVDMGRRVGVDLAMGDLRVIVGGLDVELDAGAVAIKKAETAASDRNGEVTSVANMEIESGCVASEEKSIAVRSGRTPLDLVQDDFREELEEAVSRRISISKILAACRGEDVDAAEVNEGSGDKDVGEGDEVVDPDVLEVMFECWCILSLLVLAAGTVGTVDRAKQVLGETSGDPKPCSEVVQDFKAIHSGCQSLGDSCSASFLALSKKLLQGYIDRTSIGTVGDLKSQWESRTAGTGEAVVAKRKKKKKKKIRPRLSPVAPTASDAVEEEDEGGLGFGDIAVSPPRRQQFAT